MKYSRKLKEKKTRGDWLNGYDFAYPRKDIVNSGLIRFKITAPSLIETSTNQVERAAEKNEQAKTEG